MLEKLRTLRNEHLKNVHDVVFYPYQEVISDKIIQALLQNMRITATADVKEIKKLKKEEVIVEISRQAGKTTAVVLTVEFIMLYFPKIFGKRVFTGIFAPQREQAKTDFDRLKEALFRSAPLYITNEAELKEFKEQSNSNTLVLPNGAGCYIFPVTKTSKPESKTLDLIIFEESQDLSDNIVKQQIFPMGANTNAPNVFIGTAGTSINYFYRGSQSPNAIKLYFEDIVAQRRTVYESTQDSKHLIYEQSVRQDIEKHGLDSDEIMRPYFGKWLIGTGQFVTQEELDNMLADRAPAYHHKEMACYAGIDTAKNPDSTVVTVIRYNTKLKVKEILNWLELRGDNYKDQFDVIHEFLKNYNIEAVAIDSTGQGDFMPDMFERETMWSSEKSGLYRVKFSAISKDMIYKNLKVSIKELLTTIPKQDKKHIEKFRQQMLDLQQEHKGQLLSVHHPDSNDAHDDYPDSWALAEWAHARFNEDMGASVNILDVAKTAPREEKINENNTTNNWDNTGWETLN